MTAPLDLDALERAALAATPGPWVSDLDGTETLEDGEYADVSVWAGKAFDGKFINNVSFDNAIADGAYIAAANPATMLELIRRLRAAEAAVGAKLSSGFDPSWITALHMDCSSVDLAEIKRLINECRVAGQQVLILPESHLEQLDEDAMRRAGWVRDSAQATLLHPMGSMGEAI